jgi:hypothetical protein
MSRKEQNKDKVCRASKIMKVVMQTQSVPRCMSLPCMLDRSFRIFARGVKGVYHEEKTPEVIGGGEACY